MSEEQTLCAVEIFFINFHTRIENEWLKHHCANDKTRHNYVGSVHHNKK